ncbi:MAG: hypothetical protein QW707_05555 [Candidatus Bathyarchaeia archaeon]
MEPEDYFQEGESDLSKYAKEAEKIKVISPGGDWKIEAPEEKPREKAPGKFPKLEDLRKISRTQVVIAVLAILSMISLGYALNSYLSNVISTSIEVRAPETMSLTLQNWPSQVIMGVNYTFSLRIGNTNPTLPGHFEFKFSRADGIQLTDIDIYMRDPVTGNYTKLTTKIVDGNTLIIRSPRADFPTGVITREFIITGNRIGSYSAAIAIAA